MTRLIDRLPAVRGRYRENADLSQLTWFQVGGPAEILYRPADEADLAAFLAARPEEVPLTVLGIGSNVLIRDGGISGVVIRLMRGFTEILPDGDTLRVGAGALDSTLAQTALGAGRGGLEFLSGIPGSLGGALRMNAGAFGREMKDVVLEARAVDPAGRQHRLTPADLEFGYRRCGIPQGWIFTSVTLAAPKGDPAAIQARMDDIRRAREKTQPLGCRTGGSTFKNPIGKNLIGKVPEAAAFSAPEEDAPPKAWELIDQAGCRGLQIGGAMVSDKHCNFLINTGSATAADLENLGEEIRRRVVETSGHVLEWEIRRLGQPTNRRQRRISATVAGIEPGGPSQ